MGFQIGKGCQIDPTAVINVREGFIGEGALIKAHARIEGTRVEIGREAYIDTGAVIGGGSCFDPDAFLRAGDWLHLGVNSQINIARGVTIGHEFGCGIESKIFTHGAYLDAYNLGAPVQWAPVTIGDSVWMPNAWVNPGVKVGDNVIVAARSLVNKNLPSGCLAGGMPAEILKTDYLPRTLSSSEKIQLLENMTAVAWQRYVQMESLNPHVEKIYRVSLDRIAVEELGRKTEFFVAAKKIEGQVSPFSRVLKDQLRRNGIRFRYEEQHGQWQSWGKNL